MLVQRRGQSLRLIRQHDHGLLAGALAFAWRLPGGRGLAPATALATALHDVVWCEEDRRPRLDERTGVPHDFLTFPADLRQHLIGRGVRRLGAIDAELASLVRAHHATLARGGPAEPGSQLAWLRFFDTLSLFICLTPPGSEKASTPAWLGLRVLEPPAGSPVALLWHQTNRLTLNPGSFGAPLTVEVPYRDLVRRRYQTAAELHEAWEETEERVWEVTIEPGALSA